MKARTGLKGTRQKKVCLRMENRYSMRRQRGFVEYGENRSVKRLKCAVLKA